jgi:hypothetical protein
MLEEVRTVVANVRDLMTRVEPRDIAAGDAASLVALFAELERLAVAGRTLAGRRVQRSTVWHDEGFRTPAQWMASRAQTTLSAAISIIETGRKLEELPATREAYKSGSLSSLQAADICSAAGANPGAERTLLEVAHAESVARLRERCREVIAASTTDADIDERIHRSRYLRNWCDADGAVRLDARLTPDAGARLIATIRSRGAVLIEQARVAGLRERPEAHAADALVSLADAGTPGPRAVVHVHVDESAWKRGRTRDWEMCRVAGIGPVSVAAARRLAEDGIVKAVLVDGADVRAVAHLGRTIPARLRTALEARDVTCVVPGCDAHEALEIDHIVPLAEGGPTRLDNLARLCRWHHSLKTHRRWQLGGGPGRWEWFRPRRASTHPPPG